MTTLITALCFTVAAGLLISCVPRSLIRQLIRSTAWLLLICTILALGSLALIWLSTASLGTQMLVLVLLVVLLTT